MSEKNWSFGHTFFFKTLFGHWVRELRQISKLHSSYPPKFVEGKVVHLKELFGLYQVWTLRTEKTQQVSQTFTRGFQRNIQKKIFLSSFSKFEQKTWQRFGETFSAWLAELNPRCPEELFDAQHFLEKSDFYYQFGTLSDNIMQLLATGVSACQSKVHSTLPDKLFEGKIFLGKCKYVKCKRNQAKLFWQDRQNCFLHLQWTVKKKSSLFGKNHLYVIAFTP